jgi:hypothetical protein
VEINSPKMLAISEAWKKLLVCKHSPNVRKFAQSGHRARYLLLSYIKVSIIEWPIRYVHNLWKFEYEKSFFVDFSSQV